MAYGSPPGTSIGSNCRFEQQSIIMQITIDLLLVHAGALSARRDELPLAGRCLKQPRPGTPSGPGLSWNGEFAK